jgi:hypothetical protein
MNNTSYELQQACGLLWMAQNQNLSQWNGGTALNVGSSILNRDDKYQVMPNQ